MFNKSTQTDQYATFKVGELSFGVNITDVQEILKAQDMTKVPLSATSISGLINLRGQIITAIDLSERLRELDTKQPIGTGPRTNELMNVIVAVNEETVSLLVDEVGDVMELERGRYEPTPETVSPKLRDLLSGVYKLDDFLLLVLNVERAIDVLSVG